MSKEYGISGSAKQLILMILEEYAGDPDGVNAEEFYNDAADLSGTHPSTVKKYVREQIGQVKIRRGYIFVEEGAMLISTTHRAANDTDDGDGRGISNGVKRWDFRNWRSKKKK